MALAYRGAMKSAQYVRAPAGFKLSRLEAGRDRQLRLRALAAGQTFIPGVALFARLFGARGIIRRRVNQTQFGREYWRRQAQRCYIAKHPAPYYTAIAQLWGYGEIGYHWSLQNFRSRFEPWYPRLLANGQVVRCEFLAFWLGRMATSECIP